ncbi:MAG: hypothetical protein V1777_01885 [Candidatus Micrarchaeota archaeon]
MRIPILFIALLVLLPAALSLSAETAKDNYSKGQTLSIFGSCSQTVTIQLTAAEKKVDSFTAECDNGGYIIQKNASFLYPAGNLTITASDSTNTASKTIGILATRESGFLTITFLGNPKREIQRTESFQLSVQVNNAENPAANAIVQTWLANGQKISLNQTQTGIYSGQITIPAEAAFGEWNLVVTAEQQDQNTAFGGEEKTQFIIMAAPIQIEIISPTGTTISALEKIILTVKAAYSNGQPLNQPQITAKISGQTIVLQPQTPTTFSAELQFQPGQTGLQTVEIIAADSSQNTASKKIDWFVSAGLSTQLIANLPLIILLLILLLGIWFLVIPKIQAKKTRQQLEKRKNELEKELTELQTAYFEKNTVTKEKFSQKNAEIQSELADTTKKLKNEPS